MIKNYAGTIAAGILTLLITVLILCPFVVEPHIGGIHGQELTPTEWMDLFTKWCIRAIVVCALSVIAWIYLSAEHYPVDLTGRNTQMPYWILHAIPPLLVAVIGYMLLPTITDGGLYALLTIVLPVTLQFWISSLFFSPHKTSVPGGGRL